MIKTNGTYFALISVKTIALLNKHIVQNYKTNFLFDQKKFL